MSTWENLLSTATGDYNERNFRDSYSNYLKTANLLISKLANEVTFSSRDTVKTKPNNSIQLFQQLNRCVQRVEDILQNRTSNGSLPSPQPSYISDIAPSIHTINTTPSHLPLVPFSPLTRQSYFYAHSLTTASNKVNIAKQKNQEGSSSNSSVSNLRHLMEDVRIQRSKFDNVSNQIQTISEVNLLYWDVEAVAKQLTIIDSQLFTKVDIKKDLTTKDKKNSKTQACLDFYRYLTNSFAHQFIIHADSSHQSRENIVAHGVKIAYFLLHVYRNFNSFAALVKALNSPEVRRMKRLWHGSPARTNQILKEFAGYINPASDYKAYREVLTQKVDSLRDAGQGMIAIPWMQTHYEEVREITQAYTTGNHGDSSDVLSAPGARKLNSIYALLEQCQSNSVAHDDEDWGVVRKGSSSTLRIRDTIAVEGAPVVLPLDLSCLGFGDLGLHHWLVSRVYLTKQQLIDESIIVEPLVEGEPLPCVENDYEEEEEEEEEEERASRDEFGSSDGGDNVESSDLTMINKPADTKTSSTSKPYDFERVETLDKSSVPPSGLYTVKDDQGESSSKATNTTLADVTTVKPYVLPPSEEMTKTQNKSTPIASTTFSGTPPIPIPSAQSFPSLNPNAQPFVPRAQSYSNTTPVLETVSRNYNGAGSLDHHLEMGRNGKFDGLKNHPKEDEENDEFVYDGVDSNRKVNEPDDKAEDGDDEKDEEFVYHPSDTKDNELFFGEEEDEEEEEEEKEKFTYEGADKKDDDKFVYDSDQNKDTTVNTSESNEVFTTIGKKEATETGGVPEITVKFNAKSGTD